MKLLFINVASKVFHDKNGVQYLNPHITNQGFRQYLNFCDDFTMLLRDGGYIKNTNQFEQFDQTIGKLIVYPNIFDLKNILKPSIHSKMRSMIKDAVWNADKVICGSQGGYIIEIVIKYCREFNKPYMVYCLGLVFEGQWYHSLKGKLVAFQREISCKRVLKNAPYVIYVTEEACQKRYPSKGKTLGCSDVEITDSDPNIISKRTERIHQNKKNKIVFGTAAYLDVRWKGHHVMLHAISKLKKSGYNVEYVMIGTGTGNKIRDLAKQLGIEDCIRILNGVPHSEIFAWYDTLDIYVQPSYQEGLCRSIVEAMSRACPIVCTDVGGNYELIDREFLFKRGNYKQLTEKLIKMMDPITQEEQALKNYDKSKKYLSCKLNAKRWTFIKEFINDVNI